MLVDFEYLAVERVKIDDLQAWKERPASRFNVCQMNTDQGVVKAVRREIGHKWRRPSIIDCCRFIGQEHSELDDALMRAGHSDAEYARNHQRGDPDEMVRHELGDLYMMVLTMANLLEVDLSELLAERMTHLLEKYRGK